MIVTKKKPYKEIIKDLNKKDKIGVISCNQCARFCNTGGISAMNKLVKKLKKDGYNVVDQDLIGAPCMVSQLNKSQLHGNTQILLACDSGDYNVKKIFPKHKIISGTYTVGIGALQKNNKIKLVTNI